MLPYVAVKPWVYHYTSNLVKVLIKKKKTKNIHFVWSVGIKGPNLMPTFSLYTSSSGADNTTGSRDRMMGLSERPYSKDDFGDSRSLGSSSGSGPSLWVFDHTCSFSDV